MTCARHFRSSKWLGASKQMKLRIINRKTLKAQFQWEVRDIWVGLFWRINREMPPPYYTLHLYICIVPLIPLHVTVLLRESSRSAMGYVCQICGEQIHDTQATEHTDDGLAHADCLQAPNNHYTQQNNPSG